MATVRMYEKTAEGYRRIKLCAGSFETWEANQLYEAGDFVVCEARIYKAIQRHTSSAAFDDDMRPGGEKWCAIGCGESTGCIQQITKYGVTAPLIMEIPVSQSKSFVRPPVEVLKFMPETGGASGSWNMALPGTDYTYGYSSDTLLRVTLKTDGDYKINYGGLSSSFGDVGDVTLAYILKPDYVKADGALVSREEYPLLYSFAAANNLIVTEAEWAGGMQGLYSEGDGSTTFRLPDLRGQFLRGLDMGAGVDVDRVLGSMQGDAIRNIKGRFSLSGTNGGVDCLDGVFYNSQNGTIIGQPTNYLAGGIASFDASRVVPTAEENRPVNIALIAQIKYR